MARREAARDATTTRSPESSGVTYRVSLGAIAFLVACFTALLLIGVESTSLSPLVKSLRTSSGPVTSSEVAHTALVLAVPLVAALLAYVAARSSIQLVRIQTYRRHLHGYAKRWLRTYAPLSGLGVTPATTLMPERGTSARGRSVRLTEIIHARRRALLLGARGAGKTVALHEAVYELTRKRALPRLWLGRSPLPVLLTVDVMPGASFDEDMLDAQIRASLRHFGTKGLAARSPVLLKRARIAILYDNLDQLPVGQQLRALRQCEQLSQCGRALPVIAACSPARASAAQDDPLGQLTGWQQVVLEPLSDSQMRSVLRRARARRKPRGSDTLPELLAPSLTLPATLGALYRLGGAAAEPPRSAAQVFRLYADAALSASGPMPSSDGDGQATVLAGLIAAALRSTAQTVIATAPNMSLGRTLGEWLERVDPLAPLEAPDGNSLLLRPEELETACQAALARGILMRDPEKLTLRFANGLLEAAFAARWFDAMDTGLSRFSPQLAQPEWILPVLLWAAAADHPGDIALRLLRLLDTPDSASVQAGFTSRDDYQAAVLALALGAACLSLAPVIEHASSSSEPSAQAVSLAEEQLRDLLDRLFRFLDGPDQQDALRTALTRLVADGGPEALASLRYLAKNARIPRLSRAQLVVVLGLIRSEDALAAVVSLLDEPDALIRQAVERALALAGTRALPALNEALSSPSQRVRARAAEALAQFGDSAVETALAGLSGPQAEQRAAAAHTLGTLRAASSEDALAEVLSRDGAQEVRSAAALALGQIATARAVLALEQAASADPSPLVRSSIAHALGATRQSQTLGTLVTLLADAEPRVRAAAATALGILGDERAAPALQEHRDDQDPWTQNAVVLSLRRLGG